MDLLGPLTPSLAVELHARGMGREFAVVTPCNPSGAILSDCDSAERVATLEAELDSKALPFVRVDGRSRGGRHRERGFAINAPLRRALELAGTVEQCTKGGTQG